MSVQRYRSIDLAIWLAIAVILEALIILAVGLHPTEAYVVSAVIPVVLIVMMRWGPWALIHAFGGGVALALLMQASGKTIAVYALGNCFAAINLLWFRFAGKELVRTHALARGGFVLSGWFFICLGRAIMASILVPGSTLLANLFAYARAESLTLLISLLAVFIAQKQNGLFEDQMQYLRRISKEEEERRAKNDKLDA